MSVIAPASPGQHLGARPSRTARPSLEASVRCLRSGDYISHTTTINKIMQDEPARAPNSPPTPHTRHPAPSPPTHPPPPPPPSPAAPHSCQFTGVTGAPVLALEVVVVLLAQAEEARTKADVALDNLLEALGRQVASELPFLTLFQKSVNIHRADVRMCK